MGVPTNSKDRLWVKRWCEVEDRRVELEVRRLISIMGW